MFNFPKVGDIWAPRAEPNVLYMCISEEKDAKPNFVRPMSKMFKFERMSDGMRILRDEEDVSNRWVLVS